jgi:hypothetical protein
MYSPVSEGFSFPSALGWDGTGEGGEGGGVGRPRSLPARPVPAKRARATHHSCLHKQTQRTTNAVTDPSPCEASEFPSTAALLVCDFAALLLQDNNT